METFEGRGAVITGGASGIGFASAQEFTRRGARVVLADIDQTALDAAVEQLRADGAEAHGVICDVTKRDAVEHLADESFRLLGEVNLVFNNAGIAYAGPISDVTHGDWRWVIDVDLWGPIHGVEAFLPRMIEQGGDRPHLVHIVVRGHGGQRRARTVLRRQIRCRRAGREPVAGIEGPGHRRVGALPDDPRHPDHDQLRTHKKR